MSHPPTLAARDNLVVMGLLAELPEVGTVVTEEFRRDWLEAFAACLMVLYPLYGDPASGSQP